ISNNKIGDARLVAGQLPEALAAYEAGLAIERRLAAGDAGNAAWQRDLLPSPVAIGNVLLKEGKLDGALQAYRDVLAIAERMTKAHPGEGYWQHALRLGVQQTGALAYRLVVARQFSLALDAVEQSITLAPDMIWLYSNRADALMFLDRTDEA